MTGITSTLLGMGGARAQLSDLNIGDDDPLNSGLAAASYSLESDGDISSFAGASGTGSPIDQGDWIVPKSLAPGSWECRATVVSGTLSEGTTGSWLALTSTRTWTVSSTSGTKSCTLTVEIRRGTSVEASATITLSATT